MQVYLQCSGGMIGWFITGVYNISHKGRNTDNHSTGYTLVSGDTATQLSCAEREWDGCAEVTRYCASEAEPEVTSNHFQNKTIAWPDSLKAGLSCRECQHMPLDDVKHSTTPAH